MPASTKIGPCLEIISLLTEGNEGSKDSDPF